MNTNDTPLQTNELLRFIDEQVRLEKDGITDTENEYIIYINELRNIT